MIRESFVVAAVAGCLFSNGQPVLASTQPVIPAMRFDPVTTLKDQNGRPLGYKICAHGDASFLYVFGAWEFRLDGSRAAANGTAGPAVMERDARAGTQTYSQCLTVYRLGYPTGQAHATFSYNGVGGNIPYTIEHTFTWCEGCPNPTVLGLDFHEGVQFEVDPFVDDDLATHAILDKVT